ncbi:MAG: hypothetical protein ACFFB3_01525 [Candidatus Hodarchaeota archaeon]
MKGAAISENDSLSSRTNCAVERRKSLVSEFFNPEKDRHGIILISIVFLIHSLLLCFVWLWYENIGINVFLLEKAISKQLRNREVTDEKNFTRRGKAVLKGKIPYKDFYLPTGPLMPYFYCGAPLMSQITPIHVTYWFRLLYSVFNAITSWAIYQGFKAEGEEYSRWGYQAGYLYGLNPLIIFMALIWGTDETILAALIALAAWQISRRSWFWASVLIIVGACAKYFSIFLLPFLLLTRPSVIEGIILVATNIFLILSTYGFFLLLAEDEASIQFERFLLKAPLEMKEDDGIWCFLEADGYFNIRDIPFPLYQILIIGIPMLLAFWIVFSQRGDFTRMATPGLLFLLFYSKFQSSYLLIGLWGFIGSFKIREQKLIPSLLVIFPIIVHGLTYEFLQELRTTIPVIFYFIFVLFYLAILGLIIWKILPKDIGFGETIPFKKSSKKS